MSFKIRLLELVKYSGRDLAKFARLFQSIGVENIRKMSKNDRANPSLSFLEEIIIQFPNINAHWLITGKGEMLKGSENDKKQEQPADFGKDLPRLLMERSEECGVLRTKLEQAEDELAKFRSGVSGRESDGQDARAG